MIGPYKWKWLAGLYQAEINVSFDSALLLDGPVRGPKCFGPKEAQLTNQVFNRPKVSSG